MPVIRWVLTVALIVASAATQAAWPEQHQSAGQNVVIVKIGPDWGDRAPQIRAMVEAIPFARIGNEHADYEITPKPDFPLDLLVIDATEPEEDWERINPYGDTIQEVLGPVRFEVGNLTFPDIAERLEQVLLRAARIAGLVAASKPQLDTIEACVEVRNGPVDSNCLPIFRLTPTNFDWENADSIRITNRGKAPIYVALLAMDRDLAIDAVTLIDEDKVVLIAPGVTISSKFLYELAIKEGDGQLILVSSSKPIDVESLTQLGPAEAGPNPAPLSISSDWALAATPFYDARERKAAMGGGTQVLAGMAPWMAALYSVVPYTRADIAEDARKPVGERQYLANRSAQERAHRCGGTYIGDNLVVTAAHCVAAGQYAGDGLSKVLSQRRIRLGTVMLGRGGSSYPIIGIAVHQGYTAGLQANDIALLLIGRDRGSNNALPTPALLPRRPVAASQKVMGFGWGYTGTVAPGADPLLNMVNELQHNPDILQVGQMVSLDWTRCRRKMGALLGDRMVCVTSAGLASGDPRAANVFSCRGDSGGPLISRQGDDDILVGVTNFSKGCGFKDYPSVYADVGKYVGWIGEAGRQLKPGAAIRVADPARR